MVCNHRDTLPLMPGITWLIISECLKCLLAFKCKIIDYIKFFTKSCVFYFVLLLLLFFWWFLYYDTINNFLSVLIVLLCSSGILALCATLQSEINKVMNEWMNEFWDADIQIYETQCKLSFPSSLPHPPTSRNPMRACSQTNIKLAALCQKSHMRLMEFTSGHLPMIFP